MLGDRFKILDKKGNSVIIKATPPTEKSADKVPQSKSPLFKQFHAAAALAATWRSVRQIGLIRGTSWVLRHIRYPFGHEQGRYADGAQQLRDSGTYIADLGGALLTTPAHRAAEVAKGIGGVVIDNLPANAQKVSTAAYPWLRRGGKTADFLWNYGGARLATSAYRHFFCEKRPDGTHYFSPLQAANSATFGGFVYLGWKFIAPPAALLAMGAYYYGTLETYRDIYIPNAGVFQSQNFVAPSQAGQVVAARDEIYTVQGKFIDKEGRVEPIRFDLDYNGYFAAYEDARRPDLAAAKLNSMSPYGIECDLKATGIYARLPRFVRVRLVRWIDLRPEIVEVLQCRELERLPDAFKSSPALPAPAGSTPLPAAVPK